MRNLVPDVADFLDAIWDFDDSWYNSRKSDAEVGTSNAEFSEGSASEGV